MVRDAEKDLRAMWNICRDFYFKWRDTVKDEYGNEAARRLVKKFWEKVGKGTAQLYLEYGVAKPEDIKSIARAIQISSEIMGEEVEIIEREDGVIVRHTSCPWWEWHQRMNLKDEDQAGCDVWFKVTVENINPQVDVVTLKSFEKGDNMCERLIFFRK
jgi:hypothetical protein